MNNGSSYAVAWNAADGALCAGRLELGIRFAVLSGAARGERAREVVGFDDITGLLLDRGRLHVGRRSGHSLAIASLDGPGALRELAEVLTASV